MNLPRTIALTAVLSLSLLASSAQADDAYPGTYSGKAKGAKATVAIGNGLEGTLTYKIKTACGKTKGKIALGKAKNGRFSGKRVSRGPDGSLRKTVAKLRVAAAGERLEAVLKDKLSGGGGKLAGCRGKRRIAAQLGRTDVYVPSRDVGHYEGQSNAGEPISFDVVADKQTGESTIENLGVELTAECWEDLDDDGVEETIHTQVAGLTGEVSSGGEIYVSHTPDEETEYELTGKVGDGAARLNLSSTGVYDPDGTPNPDGPLSCDNWGTVYEATLSS